MEIVRSEATKKPVKSSSQSSQELPSYAGSDVFFSADVETDGPVPGPYSMLSLACVVAGHFDGTRFEYDSDYPSRFYAELQPISTGFQQDALDINGLDRERLLKEGEPPQAVMSRLANWIKQEAKGGTPVLVAYPLSFDWSWLYWYFVQYSKAGSPFNHSRCFDVKTAYAVTKGIRLSDANRERVKADLDFNATHSHHALEDAIEQARIFTELFKLRSDA